MLSSKTAPAVAVLMAMALAIPSFAHAECVKVWKTARDVQRASALVFSGTVIKSSPDGLQTLFQVDRVWKGEVRQQTTLTMYPGIDSRDSSYFKEGMAYLVFAQQLRMFLRQNVEATSPETPVFEVSACFPTGPLDHAQEYVKQLGRGRSPRP